MQRHASQFSFVRSLFAQAARQQRSRRQQRVGASMLQVVVVLAVVAAIGSGAWWYTVGRADSRAGARPLLHPVKLEPFVHEVTERGEIESSSNVEVRCEVQSPGSSGTAIIEVIPEGSLVEAGDFLAKLDDSALQNDRTSQQIVVNSSKAAVIQAQSTLDTAQIALKEYEEGTFKQEEETLQSELFVAEENLRRAQEYVRYSELLHARGYVTAVQLEADRFAVEKAAKELEVARTKLAVLRDYTRVKMIKQLESDIRTAEAQLRSAQETYRLDLEKLNFIEQQIEKCTLRAPVAGQVLYANDRSRRDDDIIIQPGTMVRERQVMFRLPDPTRMQVAARINESRIDRVREGMPVEVRIDALPGVVAKGRVTRVSEYPLPGNWYSSSIKEYGAYVEIDTVVPGMRPGMTAQVAIQVEHIPEALQVPVQAVVERGGKHYCLVDTPDGPAAREVLIGSTNDRFVVIKDGLKEAEMVLLNPRTYADGILPEIDPRALLARQSPSASAADRSALPGAETTPAERPPVEAASSPNPSANPSIAEDERRRADASARGARSEAPAPTTARVVDGVGA